MTTPAHYFLNQRITFWSVMILIVLLFASTNLPWQLEDFDQAKQAFTSFEMVQQGHWIYQHTPNGWVATKPPLVGWISAAIFSITHSWEMAWRIPSMLAAITLLVVLWRVAFAAYGGTAAFLVASAFGLNLFAPRLATLVRTDMPLALILSAIGLLIWEKIRKREAWKTKDRCAIFALLATAMLIKGPIVYAFLLPGILIFQWRARVTREAVTAWCGWWPWVVSLAVFALWVIGGILFVPEFTEHVVLREFAGRFNEAVHRSQPLYFYFPHLLHRFAPWSILLLGLAAFGIRSERLKVREWWRAISPETFWLLAWSLGGLLVMSFVPSKRVDRIFPVVPPLCLLLAAQVADFRKREKLRRATEMCCAIALVFACLFATGYSIGKIIPGYHQHRGAFALFGNAVRREAAAHGWQYALVGGEDEGMLLYLRKTEYFEPDQAVTQWNAGMLDGLVVPDDEVENLLPRLHGAIASEIGKSGPAGNLRKHYTFFVRSL